jgi:hypothetical protein
VRDIVAAGTASADILVGTASAEDTVADEGQTCFGGAMEIPSSL